MILAPGTILQRLYLKDRIARLGRGTFIEVGPGEGHLSNLLLELGWSGVGIERDMESASRLRQLAGAAGAGGRYTVLCDDWLRPREPDRIPRRADLILACMVLEHLDDADERLYFRRCEHHLGPAGIGALLVPACEQAWGIEDVVAGHYRRYSKDRLRFLFSGMGWRLDHLAGLTYPLSNLLLPLSNWLVARAESHKSVMSMRDRTLSSGRRKVPGKTLFPRIAGILSNEISLYPAHLAQMIFRDSESALVLYAEGGPGIQAGAN